jgi:hypothetical protein
MNDDLTERLARAIGRRRFLKDLAAGTLGAVMVLLGRPDVTLGLYTYGCCTLCKPASQNCPNCACQWTWTCLTQNQLFYYHCTECYSAGPCNGGCTNVTCSTFTYEHCCAPSGSAASGAAA